MPKMHVDGQNIEISQEQLNADRIRFALPATAVGINPDTPGPRHIDMTLFFAAMTDVEYTTFESVEKTMKPKDRAMFTRRPLLLETSPLFPLFDGPMRQTFAAARVEELYDIASGRKRFQGSGT